jgi:hypothetical protein
MVWRLPWGGSRRGNSYRILLDGQTHQIHNEDSSREWIEEQLIAKASDPRELRTITGELFSLEEIHDDEIYALWDKHKPRPAEYVKEEEDVTENEVRERDIVRQYGLVSKSAEFNGNTYQFRQVIQMTFDLRAISI